MEGIKDKLLFDCRNDEGIISYKGVYVYEHDEIDFSKIDEIIQNHSGPYFE